MKKIALLMVLSLLLFKGPRASAQMVFQGTFTNVGNQLIYKVKPSSTITTSILYMQFSLGFPTASTPAFTYTLTPNTGSFPGLTVDTFASYNDGVNTWYNFYQSSSVIGSATYTGGTEYTVFTLTLSGSSTANFTFGSDSTLNSPSGTSGNSYQFLMSDNTGTSIAQPAYPVGNELYGAGRFTTATGTFVPINGVPLPIKFLSFTATQLNDDGKLSWTVANETATAKEYEIQKSVDNGISFVTIDTITITNPSALSSYSYTDANLSLVKSVSNTVYYRIKQVDNDGGFLYSGTEAIKLPSKTDPTVSVYPNPVQDFATVKFDLDADALVTMNLTDVNGRVLQTTQLQGTVGENKPTVNMTSLVNGNYVLSLNIGGVAHVFPLVKAN